MSITTHDVQKLLAQAMAFDNRQSGNAQLMAWYEVALRERWTFDEASDALQAHYAESTEYLMPAHITQRIRAARRAPQRHTPLEPAPEEPPRPPGNPEHIRATVDWISHELGWQRQHTESEEQRRALAVQCPHCHAAPGVKCARKVARGTRRGQFVALQCPHPSRVDLAAEHTPAL